MTEMDILYNSLFILLLNLMKSPLLSIKKNVLAKYILVFSLINIFKALLTTKNISLFQNFRLYQLLTKHIPL